MFSDQESQVSVFAPDILRDRHLYSYNRAYPVWALMSLLLPAVLGFAVGGTPAEAFSGFIFGGLARVFIANQAAWCVGSISHDRLPTVRDRGRQCQQLARGRPHLRRRPAEQPPCFPGRISTRNALVGTRSQWLGTGGACQSGDCLGAAHAGSAHDQQPAAERPQARSRFPSDTQQRKVSNVHP
jgi:hypothetical protein